MLKLLLEATVHLAKTVVTLKQNVSGLIFAEEKFQRAEGKWNEDQIKRLGFINQRLRQNNELKSYSANIDEVMLEYQILCLSY